MERTIKRRNKLAHVANDVIDASMGAAAGGAIGALAGPIGAITGATLGAVAGGFLGHESSSEMDERDRHDQALDDVDAEEEFFGQTRVLGVGANPRANRSWLKMQSIQRLQDEHKIIEGVLEAMEVWSEELRDSARTVDARGDGRMEAARFVAFLKAFAHERHDAKEENALFEVMARIGLSHENVPTETLIAEHHLLRGLLGHLEVLASLPHSWSKEQCVAVASLAATYADIRRRHILREDTILFPVIEARLLADARAEIEARIEQFDKGHTSEDRALRELGQLLAATHIRNEL